MSQYWCSFKCYNINCKVHEMEILFYPTSHKTNLTKTGIANTSERPPNVAPWTNLFWPSNKTFFFSNFCYSFKSCNPYIGGTTHVCTKLLVIGHIFIEGTIRWLQHFRGGVNILYLLFVFCFDMFASTTEVISAY